MLCMLNGVKRGIFQDSNGKDVYYGHLFVTYDFDTIDEDCAGQEASKLKFDYDGVSELIEAGLTYPCKVNIELNIKGKCVKVILKDSDDNGK